MVCARVSVYGVRVCLGVGMGPAACRHMFKLLSVAPVHMWRRAVGYAVALSDITVLGMNGAVCSPLEFYVKKNRFRMTFFCIRSGISFCFVASAASTGPFASRECVSLLQFAVPAVLHHFSNNISCSVRLTPRDTTIQQYGATDLRCL